jgi:hypothetical protein
VIDSVLGFASSKNGAFRLRDRKPGPFDVGPSSIGCGNTLALAMTTLKEAGTDMTFDFRKDAGYARLAEPDPPGSTMKVQLFGKSDDCAEIVEFERSSAAHRKIASIERFAPGLTILPRASKFSTKSPSFPQFFNGFSLLSSLIPSV